MSTIYALVFAGVSGWGFAVYWSVRCSQIEAKLADEMAEADKLMDSTEKLLRAYEKLEQLLQAKMTVKILEALHDTEGEEPEGGAGNGGGLN